MGEIPKRAEASIFLIFLIIYGSFTEGGAGANEGSRIALTYSLVDYQSVIIDNYSEYILVDYSTYNGHSYSDKAPGMSFYAVPAYLAIKFFAINDPPARIFLLSFLTTGIASAALCLLVYVLAGFFTKDRTAKILVTVAYGLGTPALMYSTVFYGHQVAALFTFSAFMILFLVKKERLTAKWLPFAGALLGLSFLTEYTQGVTIALICMYYLSYGRRADDAARLLLPLALVSSSVLAYNYACFGDPISFSYAHSFFFGEQHSIGILGVTTPDPSQLFDILFGPKRGLFYYSPILLFALPGFYYSLKSIYRAECIACFLICLQLVLMNPYYSAWPADCSLGARYLVPMLPFMCVLLANSFEKERIRMLSLPFLAVSISSGLLGVLTGVIFCSDAPLSDALNAAVNSFSSGKIGERAFYYMFMESQHVPFIFAAALPVLAVVLSIIFLRKR
jgi:4-amino-4-deoxy-L-arabinose transferase-like glycosyltransferase